jgi:hypothetical protein
LLNSIRQEGLGKLQSSNIVTSSFYDASGTVEVRVWEASGYGTYPQVNCSVDPDFVLVGGGAYVINGYGLLTASYPQDASLTTWVARSKEHLYSSPHTLICYAIGIKLMNISKSTLMQYMSLRTNVSSVNNSYTSTSVSLPSGYLLIGGGASVPAGAGQLLCQSNPSGQTTWQAAARAHGYYYTTSVTSYAIGINPRIAGFGNLDVKCYQAASHFIGSGCDDVQSYPESGYVLSCVGGRCTWNGMGRMLYKLQPNTTYGLSAVAGSKDHQGTCSGETFVYVCELKKI